MMSEIKDNSQFREMYNQLCDSLIDDTDEEYQEIAHIRKGLRDFIFESIVNAPQLVLDPIEPIEGCPKIELIYIGPKYCKHPGSVERYDGSLKELSEDICNLRYDKLAELLNFISDKLDKDCDADRKRGYEKLSRKLYNASHHIREASNEINKAWDISKPYM